MRDWIIGYLVVGLCITILGKLFYGKPIEHPILVIIVATSLWPLFVLRSLADARKDHKPNG